MAEAPTFTFVVPIHHPKRPPAWLDADGRLTSNEAQAARFVFRVWPKGSDHIQIARRVDELNGGLAETADIELALGNLWRRLLARYEAELWPDGRPPAETSEELDQQEVMLNACHAVDASEDRTAFERLDLLNNRQRTLAEWETLAVNVPDGWESLAERTISESVLDAIVASFRRARLERERDLGKAPPSAP